LRYSIDTSAILDGWIRYYPPDTFPGLWERMDELIAAGQLIATEEVLHELAKKDDDVHAWAKEREEMFIPIDDQIQPVVADILEQFEKLLDTRKNRSAADPFVIALAQIEDCTVVTGEKLTESLDRPNIPDVCRALDIPDFNLLQMMRNEGWKFS
jgi:O-methyltransferase involved in polyketide biosynthesis